MSRSSPLSFPGGGGGGNVSLLKSIRTSEQPRSLSSAQKTHWPPAHEPPRSLWSARRPRPARCCDSAGVSEWRRLCCGTDSDKLWGRRSGIAAAMLRHHRSDTTASPRCRCRIAAGTSRRRCGDTAASPWQRYGIAATSLRRRYCVAPPSLNITTASAQHHQVTL